MTDAERLKDWVRYYQAAHLKMNAIQAVAMSDPKLLEKFLDEIGLASRLDVIKACAGDWNRIA